MTKNKENIIYIFNQVVFSVNNWKGINGFSGLLIFNYVLRIINSYKSISFHVENIWKILLTA